MTATQTSNRIVNLAEYRAAQVAAKHRRAAQVPYLLWYPGFGYVRVQRSVLENTRHDRSAQKY
jgi:hypothetical protein